jgi:hypothetical protein
MGIGNPAREAGEDGTKVDLTALRGSDLGI